jgi:hypothetical protein
MCHGARLAWEVVSKQVLSTKIRINEEIRSIPSSYFLNATPQILPHLEGQDNINRFRVSSECLDKPLLPNTKGERHRIHP